MGRRTWAAAALVGAAVAVAYGGTLANGFAYDDHDLLTGNEYLKGFFAGAPGPDGRPLPYLKLLLTSDFAALAQRFGQPQDAPLGYYRPVIALSYLVDAFFWGEMPTWTAHRRRGGTWKTLRWERLNPVGFHLTNLLAHALNSLLVFFVARRLVGPAGACVAALLFAVHPIHTESVTWIAGRTDVLATTFFLLAFWLYLRYRRHGRRRALAGSAAAFLLGTFTKESVAPLPAVLFLWEALLGPRPRRYGLAAAYALLVLPYFLARQALAPAEPPQPDPWAPVPFERILFTLPAALGWYLRKLAWPPPFDLYPILSFAGPAALARWLPWALLHAGLLAGAFLLRRRWPVVSWAVGGLYLALAPLSCLVPGLRLARFFVDIQFPVSERFLYVPSLFFVLLFGALAARWRVLVPLAVAAALVSLPLVWQRNREWRWNLPLFAAAVRTTPESIRMRLNYGAALLYDVWEVRDARLHLEEARRIAGRRREVVPLPVLNNLVRAYFFGGDYPTAAAVEAARYPYLRRDPLNLRDSVVSLAAYALLTGNRTWLMAARERLQTLLRRSPPAFTRDAAGFLDQLGRDWARWEREPGSAARRRIAGAYAVLFRSYAEEPEPYLRWQSAALMDAGLLQTGARQLKDHLREQVGRLAAWLAPHRRRWPAKPALRFLGALLRFWRWRWLGGGEPAVLRRELDAVLAAEPDHVGAAWLSVRLSLRQGEPKRGGEVLARVLAELLRQDRPWAGGRIPPEPERVLEVSRWVWHQLGGPAGLRPALAPVLDRALAFWRAEATGGRTWVPWNRLGIRATQVWEVLGKERYYREAEAAFRRALQLDPAADPPRANLRELRRRRL